MRFLRKSVLLMFLVCASAAVAQENTPTRATGPQPTVEIEYCGMRPGRPPLKFLSFNITVRNLAGKIRWLLFPRALYEKAQEPGSHSGVDGVEVFSNKPKRSVTVAEFMGSVRLQPESAGGFQALLLPPGALVSIHDFTIEFWGNNFSPLPVHIVIAAAVSLGKTPADRWAGGNLVSAKSAEVSTRQITMVLSKFTRRRSELPVSIDKAGEITIPDALAKSCSTAAQSK